jgi:hypothetical protein
MKLRSVFTGIALSIGLLCHFSVSAQQGVQYLEKMHSKNYGKWYNTMTFIQTTEFYRNDSMIRKSTWYEALKLPYDLRIDFDDLSKGNYVLYKKDSTYRFQNNVLRNVSADINPFIFFIGGMYFMPFDAMLQQLEGKGYDVKKGYKTTWDGRPAYVIGRANEGDSSNAIWMDTDNLWFVRLVEKNGRGQVIDAHMKEHKKLSKGTTETKVDIFLNGKLIQVETYHDVKIDVPLDDKLFDPLQSSSVKHWFKG